MTLRKNLTGALALLLLTACGSSTMSDSGSTAMMVDGDGDGVADTRDSCSDTPSNVAVDTRGCAVDSDDDGAADYADRCANTPSGASVDEWGCSD